MKKFLRQCALVLVLVGLYFASDLYSKGVLLNDALPVPVLGWLFWGLFAFALYDIVLEPAFAFARLTRVQKDADAEKSARALLRHLQSRKKDKTIQEQLRDELQKVPADKAALSALVRSYYAGIDTETSRIVKNYSWKAALCVVFSRNPFVDGLVMFFSQYKMAIELMKTYGFKPSPLFNVLCFSWITANSALNGIFSQASADTVGTILADYLKTSGIEDGFSSKALSHFGSSAVEAMTAATTMYVTGWIVSRKLKGDRGKIEIKELFEMRKKARRALLSDFGDGIRDEIEKKLVIF